MVGRTARRALRRAPCRFVPGTLWLVGAATLVSVPSAAVAQAHRVGPTLRYGTGLLDVPIASVLPHGVVAVTLSGFRSALDRAPVIDASGEVVGLRDARPRWYGDASMAVGLWNRVEGGLSLQEAGGEGGSLVGGFGRMALLRPENGGIGLAVGARYVAWTGGGEREPGRLGIPDPHLVARPPGRDRIDAGFTPYVVATGTYQGPRSSLFPAYDVTLSFGVGGGLFAEGADLPFYADGNGDGWFAGSALHLGLGSGRLFTLLAEYNGFEVNAGAVLDFQGVRLGTVVLGLNHGEGVSVYRSRKLGLIASVALCPGGGGLRCAPDRNRLLERPRTDAIVLPAPPPDTVVREAMPPEGRPVSICLSTGRDVLIRITAMGDTLVGPSRVSMRGAGGDLVFPGRYATGRPWYGPDLSLEVDGEAWEPFGAPVELRCDDLREWRALDGVPLFTDVEGEDPPSRFYLPIRPGVWRVYRRGPLEEAASSAAGEATTAGGTRPSSGRFLAGGRLPERARRPMAATRPTCEPQGPMPGPGQAPRSPSDPLSLYLRVG